MAYNAKYGFDHLENKSYEEVTTPLRRLLIKDATYSWDKECETSFQTLLRMMNSKTYLAPHDPKRKTHLVKDAPRVGSPPPCTRRTTRASECQWTTRPGHCHHTNRAGSHRSTAKA